MRSRSWGCAAVLLAACSESSVPRADFADVCGQEGPVQILALDVDEVVEEFFPVRVGDRVFYTIRRFDHPITNVPATRLYPEEREYDELVPRVESIDRCGEDRRVIGVGFDWVMPPRNPEDAWLGFNNSTRELFWIDPEGERSPELLLEIDWIDQVATYRNHVYAYSFAQHSLSHFTLSPERIDSEILESVAATQVPRRAYGPWPAGPDEMLILEDSGALSALDFSTGRRTQVLGRVSWFFADETHRAIVWSERAFDETKTLGTHLAHILDRDSSARLDIAEGSAVTTPRNNTIVIERPVSASTRDRMTEVILLPCVLSVILPGDWHFTDSEPDGTIIMYGLSSHTSLVLRPGAGELGVVFEVEGGAQIYDDRLWTSTCSDDICEVFEQSWLDGTRRFVETLPDDGFGKQIRVPHHRSIELEQPIPDPDAWRPDTRSKLWLVDDTTGERALVDDDVSPDFVGLEPHETHPMLGWHTEEIVYQVRDLTSDRTGLWRARFD